MTSSYIKCVILIGLLFLLLLAQPGQVFAQSTVDLAVLFVEGIPVPEKVAYEVKAYISVLDSTGNPIKDLKAENLTVTEDSHPVQIDALELVRDEPVYIALLIDSSGSMGGVGIQNARKSAANFISGLNVQDKVAVLRFDNTVQNVIDFSTDHKAVRDEIALLDVTPGAGTCLYDAAYQALQMMATVPAGRRALVLLTDGVDEKPGGGRCSIHTEQNIIDLAQEGNTRAPIYTLGLGKRIDEAALKRLSADTGGRALFTTDATQLDAMFLRLSDHLRSQYVLRYTSRAGPGAHGLAVSVEYLKARDTDTRNFLLPEMPVLETPSPPIPPLQISFTSPSEGENLSGMTRLAVSVSGEGADAIERVVFSVNGRNVGDDTSAPYEIEVDLSQYGEGDLNLRAIAYGPEAAELADTSVLVVLVEPPQGLPTWLLIVIGAAALLLVMGVVVILLLWKRRRNDERRRNEEWAHTKGSELFSQPEAADRTYDAWEPSENALGLLIVEASDDPTMIGHRFEITGSLTRLGRSADNDIVFPNDSPVSRHHAEIQEKNGGLFLSEVRNSEGVGPTYGTFVDEVAWSAPLLLKSGDQIRLGKRLRLRFQAARRTSFGEEKTYDGLETLEDPEKTRDDSR